MKFYLLFMLYNKWNIYFHFLFMIDFPWIHSTMILVLPFGYLQVEFDILTIIGGGGGEPCVVRFKEKCLCSHHNITALKKNKYLYCLSHDKYLEFKFEINIIVVFLTNKYIVGQNRIIAQLWNICSCSSPFN